MKKVLSYLKGYEKECILGPFFKFLEALFELFVPIVMANIIDKGIADRDMRYIMTHIIILVVLAIAGLCSAFSCQYFAAKCAYGFGTSLRSALYRHINTFGQAEIDKFGTSALTTRITNDTNLVQTGVNQFIRLATRSPFLIIGAMVMSFILDVKTAVIFLVLVPIISFALYKVMKFTVPGYKNNQSKIDSVARKVNEDLDGVRVIRAFSKQKTETEKFNDMSDNLASSVIRVEKISSLLNPISTLVMNVGIAAVIIFGGHRINVGGMTQGELTAFINYMTQISLALVVFANLIIVFTKAIASAKRLEEVFDTKPAMINGMCKNAMFVAAPVFKFNNVSFKYPDAGANSVENISFEIKKGDVMGIIGGTGSGKSTITNLMARYYDPTEGDIDFCGRDMKDYDIKYLHSVMGIVPQKNVLISGTIADNLKFGKQDATEKEMWEALEIAQAADFVSALPKKLNSPVAQGGKNFSGGQRQRLCIARALVGKPDIIILDDSMSALDFATDLALRRSLKEKCSGATIIIITQRASSVKDADKILVMENGSATGFSDHKTLVETNSAYREICRLQTAVK